MATFVRMNALLITVTFVAADGSATQPTTADVSLVFQSATQPGVQTQVVIPLTYNATPNTWTALWDTAVAAEGTVFWTAYGSGALHAAQQGQFSILANNANNQNNA